MLKSRFTFSPFCTLGTAIVPLGHKEVPSDGDSHGTDGQTKSAVLLIKKSGSNSEIQSGFLHFKKKISLLKAHIGFALKRSFTQDKDFFPHTFRKRSLCSQNGQKEHIFMHIPYCRVHCFKSNPSVFQPAHRLSILTLGENKFNNVIIL